MSNPTSSLASIPDISNSILNTDTSSTSHTTDTLPITDMQAILDNLNSLRTLIISNKADTERLQLQVLDLAQRQLPAEADPPEERSESIVSPPPETEVEKLRRENAELIVRLQSGTSVVDRSHDKYPKVGDPPLFHGKKEELPGFLAGLGVVFSLQLSLFRTDRDKIMHAYTFTRGAVRNALTPAIMDERVWETTNWTRSYTIFTDYLRKNYGDPNERQTAIDKINSLKQTGSASQFFATFTEYSCTLDWPDEVLVATARRGLSEDLLEYLILVPNQYSNEFESFKDQCIRIDERVTSTQVEKKRRNLGSRSNSAPAQPYPPQAAPSVRPLATLALGPTVRSTTIRNPPVPIPRPTSALSGDPPIDWEIEGQKISEKEKLWRKDNNRCLICRASGHHIADCPRRREKPIGNDRPVRRTVVLEEEKDGSA